MPVLTIDDRRCYYRFEGISERPVLVLSHSLGLDHGMWDAQAADLLPQFSILRYDIRGHGASSATPGDYTIADLGRDLLQLLDALNVHRFALCGLSLGGMIGQWLAVEVPGRMTHLVLANTSAKLPDTQPIETRRRTVLEKGMRAVEELVMGRFFSPAVLARNLPAVASARRTLLATDPIGYAGCCAAIRDLDHIALLPKIRVPTLVISGDLDIGMPWFDHGSILTESIPQAQAVRLQAAHISNIEKPRSFTTALLDFLVAPPADRREAGLGVRRAVLGDEYVKRALAGTTDLTRDFQDLITSYAWGSIWTRPGFDHRTRRLLVLTALAALGRWEEFRLHVRSGLAHELEPCDLREALLQIAIYAGVPAANAAFHILKNEGVTLYSVAEEGLSSSSASE
jgi:3-oxoadipate enol-lactonase/4-carboxymuconolactone decarboxylase